MQIADLSGWNLSRVKANYSPLGRTPLYTCEPNAADPGGLSGLPAEQCGTVQLVAASIGCAAVCPIQVHHAENGFGALPLQAQSCLASLLLSQSTWDLPCLKLLASIQGYMHLALRSCLSKMITKNYPVAPQLLPDHMVSDHPF